MKKTFTFWKSLFLLCALVVGSSNVWAEEEEVFNVPCSSTPSGWTLSSSDVQQSGWWLFAAGGTMNVVTKSYDLSNYTKVSLAAQVATYQSGSSPHAKIEISYNGGSSFTETEIVGNPTSSSYVNISYELKSTSNAVVIRISNSISSGRGLRFKNFTLTGTKPDKTLSSIAVTTPPTTTSYKVGEAFSSSGMVVTGTYSDASTAPITNYTMKIGDDAIANGDILTSAGNKTITITSGEKTTTQDITVAGVTNLVVKTAPTKTQYKYGETLNLTGLELTATYSDSETRNITEGFTAVPANGSELTASGNVTFTYYDAQCTQAYTVGTLSSLTYNSTGEGAFANTTYTEKDYFDPTGLVVTAHYSNGIEEVVTDYTLTPNTTTELKTTDTYVTASYTWAGTAQTVNIPITVNAGTKYKVSFDAGNGSYTGGDITETEYQGGITLPAATTSISGWTFAGWAEASISNTLVAPTLYAAGDTYKPTTNKTLYAAYKNSAVNHKVYAKATSINDILNAGKAVIVYNSTDKILNNTLNGNISAPEETDGKITPPANSIFTVGGNNTEGITFSNTMGSIGTTTNTSTVNVKIEYTTTNNLWIIEASTIGTNNFALRNKHWTDAALQYYNSTWKIYNNSGYKGMTSYAMRIYIPSVTTAYNSNPSAIAEPTVEFEDKTTKLLYVKNANEYTNAATATGTEKNIDYSSSDETIASVDENGAVTALKAGTAIITARIAAEAGVSAEATDTYILNVKDASTIAGIKAVNSTTTPTAFTADLTDANITYVSETRAYIQDASAAIYVSCADESWLAGKKFNGAVSGKVKKSYGVWEITEFTGTPVEGGSVPAALTDVAIADITAETYANYEGKKITLSGVTVTAAMGSTATSGGEVSDGTNTIKIAAPATGITLVKDEQGIVTGFVAQYSGTYRLNLYEQSQFVKTHNAPKAQTLTFTSDAINLDEDTEDFTNFTPQTVSGAQGTVTYAIGGDAIYDDFNTADGTFTLKTGVYGTATITATAAAANIEEAGVITPYTETSKSYTVTTYPRYTSTFSVNGVVTVVRQATHGAEIAVPEPSDVGEYYFMGWKAASAIDTPTDVAPEMVTPPATPTNNVTYYAVYALGTGTPVVEHTSTFTVKQSSAPSTSPYVNDGSSWTWNEKVNFSSDDDACMNAGATISFTLPTGGKAVSLAINSTDNHTWAGTSKVEVNLTDNSNNTIKTFNVNSLSYDFTSSYDHATSYTLTAPSGNTKNAWISTIVFEYTTGGISYSGYRTSLPVVGVTIPASGYLSYCSPYKLDFSETNVKAYKASVNAGTVTLTKVDVVPAEEGVVLFSSEIANSAAPEAIDYIIPVTEKDASDVSGNEMVGVLARTQVEWNPEANVYNYILQQGEFRKATTPGGYLKPNRAYLSTSYNVSAQGAKALTIVFNDATTGINGVEEIAPVTKTRKVVKNGRLVIETPNGEFTIDGAKVK